MKESEEDMDIPDEVQFENLKWFPVKTLARYRAVSQTYRDVIDNRWFAKEHHRRMEDRLLLRHHFRDRSFDQKAVYALCNDDLATYDVPAELQIPDNPDVWSMVGVSKGVLCMASAELGRVVVLLNPATRRAALLPLFGSNKPVATKFGFGLHDEEEGVFRVLVICYHHENGGNSYCRILLCTNSGVGGEWRWDEVRGIPPLLSGGTSFSIDSSKSATFLDGAFHWPVLMEATVPIVEFDARRGTFGSNARRIWRPPLLSATASWTSYYSSGEATNSLRSTGVATTPLGVKRQGLTSSVPPPKRIQTVISYFKPGQLLLEFEDHGVFVFQMDGRTISLTLQNLKVWREDLGIGGGTPSSYRYESPQVVVYPRGPSRRTALGSIRRYLLQVKIISVASRGRC